MASELPPCQPPSTAPLSNPPQQPRKLSDRDFRFHYDRVLGEGSFSVVMVGTEKSSGVEWAVKSLLIKQLLRDNMREYAFRERDALNLLNTRPWNPSDLSRLAALDDDHDVLEDDDDDDVSSSQPHPFFVRLHASFKSTERLFYVLTYARNGEILDYVKALGSFSPEIARFYLAEVTSAVRHLHRCGIIHRDLKPENILLGDEMHILITDFGSCKILDSRSNDPSSTSLDSAPPPPPPRPVYGPDPPPDHPAAREAAARAARAGAAGPGMRRRAKSFVGTAQYVSPEMLLGKPEEMASDLWALGCVLYHFVAGTFPFKGATQYLIFQKIQALDFTFPEDFDSTARDLVERLVVLDPEKRLGADGSGGFGRLVRHAFFDGVDWETLHLQKAPLDASDRDGRPKGAANGAEDTSNAGFNEEDFARAVISGMNKNKDEDDDEDDVEDDFAAASNRPVNGAVPIAVASASSSSSDGASPSSFAGNNHNNNNSTASESFTRQPSSTAWTASSTLPAIREMMSLSEADKISERVKQRSHEYADFVEGRLILKSGVLEKKRRAHYPARRRMFLLTEGPRLFYVDPEKKELKGEVPWSTELNTKFFNFKKFEIRTPNRTYDLTDPEGGAIDWCQCIDAVRDRYFEENGGNGEGS